MLRFASLLLTALTSGCVYHAFSPPIRALTLETPRTLERRETALVVEGAWHVTNQEGGVETGSVRVRRGIAAGFELSAESSFSHDDALAATSTTYRVGAKGCLVKREGDFDECVVAIIGGAGGGAYDHGGVVGGDVGVIIGYENRYFVPFIATHVLLSIPVGARAVYDGDSCLAVSVIEPGHTCGPIFNVPQTTFGVGGVLGFRVPLPSNGRIKSGVLVGAQLSDFVDADKSEAALTFAGGIDVAF